MGSVAQRDKASDYEPEDSRFESWQSPFLRRIKKTFPLEPSVTKKMFRTPSNILVVGPSGSGKTVFVSELLKEPHRYFRPVPKRLHYCYGAMQPLLTELRDGYKVGMHKGLPTETDLTRWFGKEGGILVLDDLMAEGGNDKQVLLSLIHI